jgi:hypothetical protein
MKRIIFGVLALVVIWQLVQLPSVNAALFAFLALGINPVTNHPFSTASIVSILITLGFASLMLLFSRFLGDFFGGLADWLTQASNSYGVSTTMPEREVAGPTLASLPARSASQDVPVLRPTVVVARLGSMMAAARAFPLPHAGVRHISAYTARIRQQYHRLANLVQARLQMQRNVHQDEQTNATESHSSYLEGLAPELAEVVSIFEKLALEPAFTGPVEAIVIDPAIPKEPNAVFTAVHAGVSSFWSWLSRSVDWLALAMRSTAVRLGIIFKATRVRASDVARTTGDLTIRAAKIGSQELYRMVLRITLWLLISSGLAAHVLLVTIRSFGRALVYTYRRTCQVIVFCGISITLGMFMAGRGLIVMVRALGRGAAASCRGAYALLAFVATLALLAAGYILYVFSLVSFLLWELFEPYARKLDKLLGDTIDSKEGVAEMTKVGREMSRTFVQWYHDVRHMMHSTYR